MPATRKAEAARRTVAVAADPAGALHSFAKVVAVFAFLLLLAGGLVTSTGSGLSVPDWPLSFGKLMPAMIGGVAFEHGHRLIAGCVAALTGALTLWLHLREPRRWVRRLGYAASCAILAQAALGGLTVLLRLPPAVSVSHACLAQAVFCLLLCIAQATSPWFRSPRPRVSGGSLWKLGAAAAGAAYVQLILGALLRHTGQGLYAHAGWASMVALLAWTASTRGINAPSEDGLSQPSSLLSLLVLAQLCLGYAAYRVRFSPDFTAGFSGGSLVTTAHLGVGALLLGTTVIWTLRASRGRLS